MPPVPVYRHAMTTRKLIGSLALVVAFGVLSSCGDGGGSKISKAEFITKANARCTILNGQMDEASAAVTTEEEQIAFFTDALVPDLRAAMSDIRALGFPKGDEALLDGLMDQTEDVLTQISADPASFVGSQVDPFAEINAQLAAYGLTVCGQADA